MAQKQTTTLQDPTGKRKWVTDSATEVTDLRTRGWKVIDPTANSEPAAKRKPPAKS
jgi:hypothetical protein